MPIGQQPVTELATGSAERYEEMLYDYRQVACERGGIALEKTRQYRNVVYEVKAEHRERCQ